jgi:hypothetical protein
MKKKGEKKKTSDKKEKAVVPLDCPFYCLTFPWEEECKHIKEQRQERKKEEEENERNGISE